MDDTQALYQKHPLIDILTFSGFLEPPAYDFL